MVMPHFSIFVICPIVISPHLCVGFLFLILYLAASAAGSSSSASSASSASSITQNFVTHHLSFTHTQLCHTPSFTHNFVNHHLSHASFSTTISHTHLCHTPSVTLILVNHRLSQTIFHTHLCQPSSFTHIFVNHDLSHTSLSHTICHTHLCQPPSFTHRLVTSTSTSAFVSSDRRGTWSHPPSFCVEGVALMALGWLWWRVWARLVAGDAAQLCVAGVALGDIHLRFAWQA